MPNVRLRTVEEMKAKADADSLYKYVVVGGQYRFASHLVNHSEMVDKEEKAEGAGTFAVHEGYIRWMDSYSTTLKIGSRQQDEDDISAMFGMPVRGRWE